MDAVLLEAASKLLFRASINNFSPNLCPLNLLSTAKRPNNVTGRSLYDGSFRIIDSGNCNLGIDELESV